MHSEKHGGAPNDRRPPPARGSNGWQEWALMDGSSASMPPPVQAAAWPHLPGQTPSSPIGMPIAAAPGHAAHSPIAPPAGRGDPATAYGQIHHGRGICPGHPMSRRWPQFYLNHYISEGIFLLIKEKLFQQFEKRLVIRDSRHSIRWRAVAIGAVRPCGSRTAGRRRLYCRDRV